VLASCLRDDERPSLPEGKQAASNPVAAADGIVADGYRGAAEAQEDGSAAEDLELDPVGRLATANEPMTGACNFEPISMAEDARSLLGELHHRTGRAYALLGHEGTVGVTPLQ
jgi:hypothetical protein